MIEKNVPFAQGNTKLIERLLEDDNVGINHMILPKGEALPIHKANSHVYMIVVRGTISLKLDAQEEHVYEHGNIILIPHKTLMEVYNTHTEPAEIFVVKAPSPRHMLQD